MSSRVRRAGGKSTLRLTLAATVTPLASILGSGLLIIVPILERTLGALAMLGVLGILVIAWFVGSVIRHNVVALETAEANHTLDERTALINRIGDAVIVVAYVISVALYLRIMAQYIVGFFRSGGDPVVESIIAGAVVVLIVVIGAVRGFAGLDRLDRYSLATVLALTVVLVAALLTHDAGVVASGEFALPPIPEVDSWTTLLILGGTVITVQGFETVRFLGAQYDATIRVTASRYAQLAAAAIYVAFVIVATPAMGLGTASGADVTLLTITARAAPWLALPLVLSAVLSQFSAAIADVSAADGNLRGFGRWFSGSRPYLITGVLAIALTSTLPLLLLVSVASRAFAAYYAIEAVIAVRTSTGVWRKLGFGTVAALMATIAALAQPAA